MLKNDTLKNGMSHIGSYGSAPRGAISLLFFELEWNICFIIYQIHNLFYTKFSDYISSAVVIFITFLLFFFNPIQ